MTTVADATTKQLAACPDSPNCVCTQADPSDQIHCIQPLTYTGAASAAMARLLAMIKALPRATIITNSENYLHVEFRSLVFRFVDDVEFVLDDQAKHINFRSASRLGHSDLGVNRKRMEAIRQQFNG